MIKQWYAPIRKFYQKLSQAVLFRVKLYMYYNPSSLKPFSQTYSLKGRKGSLDPSPRFLLCMNWLIWDLAWMLIEKNLQMLYKNPDFVTFCDDIINDDVVQLIAKHVFIIKEQLCQIFWCLVKAFWFEAKKSRGGHLSTPPPPLRRVGLNKMAEGLVSW